MILRKEENSNKTPGTDQDPQPPVYEDNPCLSYLYVGLRGICSSGLLEFS